VTALSILVQLAVIIVAARATGTLFRIARQPAVVGEMFAGILLGPSFLGHFFPSEHARLFTDASRPALNFVAQAGVVLFMFVVGTRIELDVFRRHSRAIVATAAASIAVPFVLGLLLASQLYPRFGAGVPELPFVLFIATALSVTAFPVLARILTDRGLERTANGRTALVCAAINDAVAWALVASVVGLVRVGATVPFTVHGVFIAFVTGVVAALILPGLVPFVERVERPASRYLLPVFFAMVGLRTNLYLITGTGGSVLWCLAIILVATAGKVGGTTFAGRAAGMPGVDALTLGILMNTRGLMELVVLNIGHDLGLLPAGLFAMMVVMALVTTCMTGPLLDWVVRSRAAVAAA
jgi:Kef-type K+ transport system membrane component KefB